MPINAAERADVKLLEKLSRQKAAQSAEVLKGIMASAAGREWMYELLYLCHIGANPFNPDIAVMSFQCGEMNVGQRLWSDLMRHCPDQYTIMTQEANERSILLDTITERSRSADADGGVEDPDDGAGYGADASGGYTTRPGDA